ncbi:hypothetical protein GDO78_011742 [Eleutherodactylus coqui]|uniref:Uncharacterized protein n=1 Tax=Eleutherodactylus coqui TaxID=57060 RepID=A0A8J6K4V4_ELECQ|nr:hypothetical protein GDO78_011742 [Eleutherodactylus coqui]
MFLCLGSCFKATKLVLHIQMTFILLACTCHLQNSILKRFCTCNKISTCNVSMQPSPVYKYSIMVQSFIFINCLFYFFLWVQKPRPQCSEADAIWQFPLAWS